MKTPKVLFAISTVALSACAPMAAQRQATQLSFEYGRHLTISYAAARAASGGGCRPIDPQALSPGVVHSPRDQAADAFIRSGYRVCRYPQSFPVDGQPNTVVIANYVPQDASRPGMLFLGSPQDTLAGTAFWKAAGAASRSGPTPWAYAFFCVAPINPATEELGTTECYLTPEEPTSSQGGSQPSVLRGRLP